MNGNPNAARAENTAPSVWLLVLNHFSGIASPVRLRANRGQPRANARRFVVWFEWLSSKGAPLGR